MVVHTPKVFLPFEIIDEGIEICTKDLQPLKGFLPIEVIEKGISICFKEQNPLNELDPIEMTEIFNSTFFRNMAMAVSGDTLSVYIGNSSLCIISYCTIHTRQTTPKDNIFQFRVFSSNVILSNNIFDKKDYGNIVGNDGFSGIYFDQTKNMDMMNNYFETRNIAVYINDIDQINILNNTWKNCDFGSPPVSALYLKSLSEYITFRSNTFKDMKDTKRSKQIIFLNVETIVIDKCEFKNLSCMLKTGGIGMAFNNYIVIKVIFKDSSFINNIGDIGGSIQFCGKDSNSLELIGCYFEKNKADKGGAISINELSYSIIKDCIFLGNNATFGAAIYIKLTEKCEIINCIFKYNKASSGGSILVDDLHYNSAIIINNCTFESNEAYYGEAIVIGHDDLSNIKIMNNKFIDNFDKSLKRRNSSIIVLRCDDHIYHGMNKEILKNNYFSNELNGEKIFVNRLSCIDDHYVPSDEFSNSDMFTLSDIFISSDMFTSSDEFSNSDMFTSSDEFSNSYMFTSSKTISTEISNILSKSTKQVTFSKSYSLTYVEKKSVSYSLSYFVSNTYDISYDIIDKTYRMYITQSNYHSYFPYIIKYLSPIYIEKDVTIEIIKKKTISKENLIGIFCGSASAFFLILGIIILSVRRRNEIINQYNEFDDISSSSIENERPKANNRADVNNETNLNDDQTNVDDEVWI